MATENGLAAKGGIGKALLISPVCPDPLGNGLARRAWSWAAALASEHHLVTAIVDAWSQASTIPAALPGTVLKFPRGAAPVGDPRAEQFWPAADFAAVLQRTFAGEAPARIIVFRLYMDGAVSLLPKDWRAIAEIDWDDYESATRQNLAGLALRRGRLREALAHWRDGAACERAEHRALATYRTVHLASPEDAAAIRRHHAAAEVRVHPNRIAGPLRLPSALPTGAPTILFVGTLGYLPNEDAVLWLAQDIAPRLRRLVRQVRIAVVGAASDRLAARMRVAGLEYLGPLADLTAAYAEASLAVAPLRGGGGTKIKVLEAWQYGRAVVATSHACRGLPVTDGQHLLRADTASGIAAACARILHDPALGSRLALAGQALLRENFLVALPFKPVPLHVRDALP